MTEDSSIEVTLLEQITLNQIMERHGKYKLEFADQILEILKVASKIDVETPIEELELIQKRLRLILDDIETKMRETESDKQFVNNIMERKD